MKDEVEPVEEDAMCLADMLREILPRLSTDGRIRVFEYVVDGYCVYCGRVLTGTCHCTNDE